MNSELIAKARAAKSAEELAALAKENGIDITEEIANEYFDRLHPALGELVRSRLYRDAVLAALDARSDSARGKTLAVYVPRGAVSAVSGHKKSNKAVFEEKSGAKCVKILEKDELCGYNVSIDIF